MRLRGLSAKILLLAVAFVLLGEVLIYVPSIARFRLAYLRERVAAADLATLTLDAEAAQRLDMNVEEALLKGAGVLSIVLHSGETRLILGQPTSVDAVVDLRDLSWSTLIPAALDVLAHPTGRMLRLMGNAPSGTGVLVDVTLDERPLREAMLDYSFRILTLSLVLSAIVALLLFASLHRMIVEPLRRVTAALKHFREHPEDQASEADLRSRRDEIGIVQNEFASMRVSVRAALAQRTKLAALGAGMSRMSHDLRNVLATAVLISDRLESSADPSVRQVAPRLVDSLDRAIRLCTDTLRYARSGAPDPKPVPIRLAELVERLRNLVADTNPMLHWDTDIPDGLGIRADQDQIFRILTNLARNAAEAMPAGGTIRLTVSEEESEDVVTVEMADSGPGIPDQVREHLFEPFGGSTKSDGSGLGLAIAREFARAHGGDLELMASSPAGTRFRLTLPRQLAFRFPAPRMTTMAYRSLAFLVALFPVVACSHVGNVGGYPNTAWLIRSYYENNAQERGASCNSPSIQTLNEATIIEDTPQKVVMRVKYFWIDRSRIDNNDPLSGGFVLGVPGGAGYCQGWNTRDFTFDKMTDGTLTIAGMSGPQRRSSGF
ncbi:MAG: HAMP domain-containing sensor histidine kinase [Geminicoccaceae bacterium]